MSCAVSICYLPSAVYQANSSHSSRTTLLPTVPMKLLRCWAVKHRISCNRCSGLRIVRTSIQSTMRCEAGCSAGACLPLKNSWRQPLEGATDRGVVRLGSQHHLCSSESLAYSSASLRACWWRALWTSVLTATATVTSFELIRVVNLRFEC